LIGEDKEREREDACSADFKILEAIFMCLCVHFSKERGDSLGKNDDFIASDVIGNPISVERERVGSREQKKKKSF